MDRVTITEATRQYHISEKTLRKWIRHGDLSVQEIFVQRRRYVYLETSELERVIAEKEMEHTRTVPNQSRESEILERLEAIERRLDTLEQQERPVQPARQMRPMPEVRIPVRQVESQETELPEGEHKEPLPEGWVGAVAFGKRHGIGQSREADITDAIRAGKLEAHGNLWKEGRATIKHALDPEMQRKFCIYFAIQRKLKRCSDPDCVCYTLQ